MASTQFGVVDYIIFSLVLSVSAIIGVYFLVKGRNKETTNEYLLAGQRMRSLPVACSILASIISAISLMGFPAEVYLFGSHIALLSVAYVAGAAGAGLIFVPVYRKLNSTSINEYLNLRFNRTVALCGTFAYIIQMELYLVVALYAPGLALSTVTGISLEMSVLTAGIVCTFYTTLGGMKAVIWTDAFQVIIMLAGLLSVIVQGLIEAGGFSNVWEAGLRGKRIGFIDFDLSPSTRMTFWSVVVGGTFLQLSGYAVNQTQVQRYLTQPTLRRTRMTLAIAAVGCAVFCILTTMAGLVMYARYENCDPLTAGYIEKPDQILPYFVMDTMSFLPGLPGLFVSAIMSGTLSSLSSGFNSFAAIIVQDVVVPFTNISVTKHPLVCKLISLMFGVITTCGAFVVGESGNIAQIALTFYSVIGGPMFGLFTAGMLLPFVHSKGALTGLFAGVFVMFWVFIGAMATKPPPAALALATAACDASPFNTTTHLTTLFINSTTVAPTLPCGNGGTLFGTFYSTSFMWYSLLGWFTTLVVAALSSFYSGCQDLSELDPRTLFPPVGRLASSYLEKSNWYPEQRDESGIACDDVIVNNGTRTLNLGDIKETKDI